MHGNIEHDIEVSELMLVILLIFLLILVPIGFANFDPV